MKNRSALVALMAVLLMALTVAPAIAAKGGNGGGGKGGGGRTTTYSATLVVNPDPVSAFGGTYHVTGTGFAPDQIVAINEGRPNCCTAYNVMADSNGNVSFTRSAWYEGEYSIKAMQKFGRKYQTMAYVTFSVVADS